MDRGDETRLVVVSIYRLNEIFFCINFIPGTNLEDAKQEIISIRESIREILERRPFLEVDMVRCYLREKEIYFDEKATYYFMTKKEREKVPVVRRPARSLPWRAPWTFQDMIDVNYYPPRALEKYPAKFSLEHLRELLGNFPDWNLRDYASYCGISLSTVKKWKKKLDLAKSW